MAPPTPAATMMNKPATQAGVSLQSGGDNNPNPIQHGAMGQAERAFSAASTFLSGIMAISASQLIGAPLKLIDTKIYEAYMARTKESFAVLVTTITQWWAPTEVRVSGDESMKDQLFVLDDGTLKCNFPHRLILMGNHQLYTDWLYLWWIAYTNKMHGQIYIILKESLKRVPIIGWGMQFYNFIFLSRKWEQDRHNFKRHLDHLKDPKDPMWLLIFPEGTNLSAVTREKSAKWAEKTGVEDMKHQLLPRTTGLQFCLKELRTSTNWLYDCTIAYEGVPQGMYGQDIFTLKSSLFEGRPPKSVNMYWRRFRISQIPHHDDEQFSRWLMNRWREKDYILEYYYKFGNFPSEEPSKALMAAKGQRKPLHTKTISTSIKGGGWDEFLTIFGPITSAAGALSNVDMTEPLNFEEMYTQIAQYQQNNPTHTGDLHKAPPMQEAIPKALFAANKQSPLSAGMIEKLLQLAPLSQPQINPAPRSSDDPLATQKNKTTKAHRVLPKRTGGRIVKTTEQSDKSGPGNSQGKKVPATPTARINSQIPLANMEGIITRPLTTIAVHTAGRKLQSLAAQQAQRKKPTASKQANSVGNATSTAKIGALPDVSRKVTNAASPNGVSRPSSVTTNTTRASSATIASVSSKSIGNSRKPAVLTSTVTPTKVIATRNTKPIGTQKYVDGKLV